MVAVNITNVLYLPPLKAAISIYLLISTKHSKFQ